jgi:hypothetical protein
MSGDGAPNALCAQVFERLVEGQGDVGADRVLTEHLGSCVTCFRALTELRDVPRLADALRGAPPFLGAPAPEDRFWDRLAERTTAAAGAALQGRATADTVPPGARPGRWPVFARARTALVATAVAAAAALALVAHRPGAISARAPELSGTAASLVRAAPNEEGGDATAEVSDLDGTALRRLLDRLRTRAPAVLTSSGGGDSSEAVEVLGDDDGRVNDELADLDGTALRRVASSLGENSL